MAPFEDPRETPFAQDRDTARLMKRRDPEGLRRLLQSYGGRVKWWLKKEFATALAEQEIEEAINLAAQRAWSSAHTYDDAKGSLRAWFYVIARNAALSVLRRELRERRCRDIADWDLAGFLAPPTVENDPTDEHRRFLEHLRQCIEKLSRMQRAVIKADLRAGDIADAGELARELRTTKNSIYVSRSMARKTLRKALTDAGYFPDPSSGEDKAEE